MLTPQCMKTAPLWLIFVAFGLASAGCDRGETEKGASTETPQQSESKTDVFKGVRVHTDLSSLRHLAEVEEGGWAMDFGTPAQSKFTVGDWRSGWLSRGVDGDRTFAHVGMRGRVYFSVDQVEALVARVVLRSYGTQVFTPYLNNTQLKSLTLKTDGGFSHYDVTLPAENVRRGENYFLLTFGGTQKIGGKDVAVALDSIRIAKSIEVLNTMSGTRSYDSLVSAVSIDDEERVALVAKRPGTIRYYLEVPEGGKLGFGVGLQGEGEAAVALRVRAEGGEPKTIFEGTAKAKRWSDKLIDLGVYAGQIIRVDFSAVGAGQGRVAWSNPRIYLAGAIVEAEKKAKNVIVLLIDTLRADKLSAFNKKSRVKTPVIDALAKEGAVFLTAQSPENWTKPAVASVLTGLHPMTHQQKTGESALPASAVMVSEHLKENGFATGSFIANGYVSDRFGFDQGWDHYTNYIRENKSVEAQNVFKEAGDWIEANKDKRFFAYIQTIDPHVPYDPPQPYVKMYDPDPYDGQVRPRMTGILLGKAKRRPPAVTFDARDKKQLLALHDGEITQHDKHLGTFIERMKALGVWDNSVFVITSDHGEEFNDHGSWGHGHSIYQELLHVPLYIRLPGVVEANKRVENVVSTMDISATVLDASGVEAMPTDEGQSLLGYTNGSIPSRPALAFSDFQQDRRVITAAGWKFILRGNLTSTLFDLSKDPREKNETTAAAHPIAQRYLRIMQSQFLGAKDRAHWLDAEQGEKKALKKENADMDEQIKEQLKALGYAH